MNIQGQYVLFLTIIRNSLKDNTIRSYNIITKYLIVKSHHKLIIAQQTLQFPNAHYTHSIQVSRNKDS